MGTVLQERPREMVLTNTKPGHNKQYIIKLQQVEGGWLQTSLFGPIGGTLSQGTGMKSPDTFESALRAFEKLVANKRTKSGYAIESDSWVNEDAAPAPSLQDNIAREDTGLRPMLLDEASEELAPYLTNAEYVLQPKRDGDRVFVQRLSDGTIRGAQRQGLAKPLPQAIVNAAMELTWRGFASSYTLDGELVGDTFCVFDLLELNGQDYRAQPYLVRLAAAIALLESAPAPSLEAIQTFTGTTAKTEALQRFKEAGAEGVVFKLRAGKYVEGRRNGNVKVKFWRTASCIVMRRNERASVQVGLLNEAGDLVDVGNISINGTRESYSVGDIVEVKYLYVVNEGGKLVQAQILRKRDDVDRADCTVAKQLQYRGTA